MKTIAILACLLFISCDGGGDSSDTECIEISNNPNFLSDFVDCPADGIVRVCEGFTCNDSQNVSFVMRTSTCREIDCFSMNCEWTAIDDPMNKLEGVITELQLDTETEPSVFFTGTANIDGEDFVFDICGPIVP